MARLFGFGQRPGRGEAPAITEKAEAQNGDIKGLWNLYCPEEVPAATDVRDLADILREMGLITGAQLSLIRSRQKERGGCEVAEVVRELKLADETAILTARAKLYGYQFRQVKAEDVDKEVFGRLEIEYVKNNRIMPIGQDGDRLVVATSRPADVFVIEDVKRQVNSDIEVVVCADEDIGRVCESLDKEKVDYCLDDIISDMTDVEVVQDQTESAEDLEKMAGQSPVIKFVNYLISNAIHQGASDIHIEPKEKYARIRYRIDGELFETMQPPLKMHPAIVSRIKIMANLDISERRLPQDGKIAVIVGGRAIDLRISTLPTNHGEKVVIRILDSRSIMRGLETLGMEPDAMEKFREQINLPHGILLVTGPTGSGKSTTLYAAICQMDGNTMNISTVEDPVEYELDFCTQVQTSEKIGLDFAATLRCLLRQDPDIIMIGEIRDNETARIAVQAALTGHLVLSTLHTNDAASSITRLVNIGIEPYLIAASLNAVLAQRLVRRVCGKCSEPYSVPENLKRYLERAGLEGTETVHGRGCEHCRGSGYSGRIGIYELLVVDDIFREMINQDTSVSNMRKVFRASGAASLFDDGIRKVKQGLTTLDEVLRVTEAGGKAAAAILEENPNLS